MKLKTTDIQKITKIKCEIKGCNNKSYAILKKQFLCEYHFREKHPSNESALVRYYTNHYKKMQI